MDFKKLARLPAGTRDDYLPVCQDLNSNSAPEITFQGGDLWEWLCWERGPGERYRLAFADTARGRLGIVSGNFGTYDGGDVDIDGLPDMLGRNIDMLDSVTQAFWNVVAVMECPDAGQFPTRLMWSDRLNLNSAENGAFCYPGDMDGDGLREVIAVEHHGTGPRVGTVIYECKENNTPSYIWSSAECGGISYAYADFDLDGRMEVASCGGYYVRTIESTADDTYWVPPWSDHTPWGNGYDVFSGRDVDGNGKPEFFVNFARWRGLDYMHYLYGWEATGDNVYRQFFIDSVVGAGPFAFSKCGDIDGDGADEILLAADSKAVVYKGIRPGEFEAVHTWYGTGYVKVAIHDLNANGYNEVVLASADHVDVYEIEAIRLLTPNAGGLVPGETCRVSWETFDPPRCDSVSLFLRRDSTWLLDTIATGLAPADTPYCWIVPDIRADSCWLVAIAYGPGWQYDESDSVLRIPGGGIGEDLPRAAYTFRLSVLPNPAPGRTSIRYELTRSGPVTLAVYDQTGRQVAVLASGVHGRGRYRLDWHCTGTVGSRLPAGVYFLRLEAGEGLRSEKAILSVEGR